MKPVGECYVCSEDIYDEGGYIKVADVNDCYVLVCDDFNCWAEIGREFEPEIEFDWRELPYEEGDVPIDNPTVDEFFGWFCQEELIRFINIHEE